MHAIHFQQSVLNGSQREEKSDQTNNIVIWHVQSFKCVTSSSASLSPSFFAIMMN